MSNITGFFAPNPLGEIIIWTLAIGVALYMITHFIYISGAYERFLKYRRFWDMFYRVFKLSAYGCLTVVAIGTPVALVWFSMNFASDIGIDLVAVLKFAGVGLALLGIFAIIGAFTEKRWLKYFENRNRYKKEVK